MAMLLSLAVDPASAIGPGQIDTVAGNGTPGWAGDTGSATQAQLNLPYDAAPDAAGNLYIADTGNNRIRKVDQLGTITTFAGMGVAGYSGDGGPATVAQLNYPTGVAVGPDNSVYVADVYNHRIRRIDRDGIISTIAGTGQAGYTGDLGPATAATLSGPQSVAFDRSGNLFIADRDNHSIRKVDRSGVITTVAGTGQAGFSGDGGPATSAALRLPYGLSVGADGSIYIADSNNDRIRKVNQAGRITTIAGTMGAGFSGDGGPATSAQLSSPTDVVTDAVGQVYVADNSNNRIRKIDALGVITTIAGSSPGWSGDGGPSQLAQLNSTESVSLDHAGNLYVADVLNHRVRRITTGSAAVISPPSFPSDDCATGTLIDGFIGDSYVKVRHMSAAQTTSVCVRVEGASTMVGGRFVIVSPGITPTVPPADDAGGSCPQANAPFLVGDPSDPTGQTAVRIDTFQASYSEVWVCINVTNSAGLFTAISKRLHIPTVQGPVQTPVFLADANASHVGPEVAAGSRSQECIAGSGHQRVLNAAIASEHLWLYAWQPSPSQVNLCARISDGTNSAGGRLFVDTSSPQVGTIVTTGSVPDDPACTANIAAFGGVSLRRSGASPPVSLCVTASGSGARLTVNPLGTVAPTWNQDAP